MPVGLRLDSYSLARKPCATPALPGLDTYEERTRRIWLGGNAPAPGHFWASSAVLTVPSTPNAFS